MMHGREVRDRRIGQGLSLRVDNAARLTTTRTVCAHSARDSKIPAMSRAKTWRSNTGGPSTKSIGCRS